MTVGLLVTDDEGETDIVTATVNVANVAPTIHAVSNDGPVIVSESATITVDASDPAGAADPLTYAFDCGGETTDSTIVTVLGLQAAIEQLIDQVQALMDDGVLSAVEGGRLLALLNDAVKGLERGNGQTSVVRLNAFVQRIIALLDRGVLTPDEGQPLIDLAQRIIAAIEADAPLGFIAGVVCWRLKPPSRRQKAC